MGEFFFVIKSLLFTVVIVMCLQIKIGSKTLEQRSLSWMRESTAVHALRGVAESAVVLVGEGMAWARHTIGSENESSRKDGGSNWKRSKAEWAEELETRDGGDEID